MDFTLQTCSCSSSIQRKEETLQLAQWDPVGCLIVGIMASCQDRVTVAVVGCGAKYALVLNEAILFPLTLAGGLCVTVTNFRGICTHIRRPQILKMEHVCVHGTPTSSEWEKGVRTWTTPTDLRGKYM